MSKLTFPHNFLWGAATGAEQIEGKGQMGKGDTKWDLHFRKHPEDFFGKVSNEITSDFIHNWKQDIADWKNITNFNSVRLGFSWARLFPDGVNLNKEALKFYHNVIDELNFHGIKPIMTIFHFDMPAWAMNIGGWSNMEVVNAYVKYASFLFDEFDSKVFAFATMNEPVVPIMAGYLKQGKHWPLVYDPQLAFDCGNRMILAHARAVNVFKSKPRKSKISVVVNVSPTHARNENDAEDVLAAHRFHVVHNQWILDPMILGTFPQEVIEIFKELGANKFILTPSELEEISRVDVDMVGTNYYFPSRFKKYEGEEVANKIDELATSWKDPKARMNIHRGWEIFPQDIYNTAMLIKNKYKNKPFWISENGMGVENEGRFRDANGAIQDDYRIAFVQEHLEWVYKAIQNGANCVGYHMWAISDCWSWVNAYKNRYGFFEVDIETQRRIPKKSAHWFKQVIADNGFDSNYTKLDELKN